jgi:phage terminase large subunit-like protein
VSGFPSVGLVEACDDPDLLGFPLWPRQREILAAVEEGPRTHVWALGRRSGKTTMTALVGLWSCLLRPGLDDYVRPGERRYSAAAMTSLRQARLFVRAARSIVQHSPLLADLVESETEDEILFANGAALSAFPCTSRGSRGWSIDTLILDELAHFVDTEGNSAAESVWRALTPGTIQFGPEARIIASSTPWGASGLFAELHAQAASGELADAVAQHASTAEMNPTINPDWLAAEQARDPESFKSEYEALFVGSGGSFFDAENIAASVTLPGELRPIDGVQWVAGLDPGFSHDPFAVVLVGRVPRDPQRLLVGLVQSWSPPRRKARSLDDAREIEDTVLAEVAQVIRLFDASAVTDQFKSAGVVDRLGRYGIRVRSEPMTATTKDAAFGFLRGRFNEGSIEMFEHPELLRELRAIRTRYAAGRSSVVLPRMGGGHCDHAQALAVAVFEHDRHGWGGDRRASVGIGRGIPIREALAGTDEGLYDGSGRIDAGISYDTMF